MVTIPKNVVVDGPALLRVIDALNGPPHLILELLHTRGKPFAALAGIENPIDVLEDRLAAYLDGRIANRCCSTTDEDYTNCALRNYQRIG